MSKKNIVVAGATYSGVEKVSFTTAEGGKATYVETSDGTASANEILNGETAYVNGSKITGSLVPLDTSDATAVATEILKGETAYVNGQKITGLFDPSFVALDEGNNVSIPTTVKNNSGESYMYISGDLGNATPEQVLQGYTFTTNDGVGQVGTLVPVDTSDATAVAREICLNKTAYVNGEKITGNGLEYKHKAMSATASSSSFMLHDLQNVTFSYAMFEGWINYRLSSSSTAESYQRRFAVAIRSDGTIAGLGNNNDISFDYTNNRLYLDNDNRMYGAAADIYYRIF